MIFGVLERAPHARVDRALFEVALGGVATHDSPALAYPHEAVALAYLAPLDQPNWKALQPAESGDLGLAGVFTGRLASSPDKAARSGSNANVTGAVLSLYRECGARFPEKLNGTFAFAVWDRNSHQVVLGRDHFGIEPLYYYLDTKRLVFGSTINPIRHYLGTSFPLNLTAVGKFLLFNYNPGLATFWSGITRLRPAHTLTVDGRSSQMRRYWKLSFADTLEASEQDCQEQLLVHLNQAVSDALDDSRNPGVFLSGGLDSSTVLALTSRLTHDKLQTYSYRCRAESFDELHYAQSMARSVGAQHQEVEFTPADVLMMPEIVRSMNEPFCDIGINIASVLLGKAAGGAVSYVFTGDGGDELFAGHPVYEADKIAAFADWLPGTIKRSLSTLGGLLPDSDKKKNLIVMIKRFSESLGYPPELLSHRWRIYYSPQDLEQLYTAQAWAEVQPENLYLDMFGYAREADGREPLSQSLYSDYQTVVDFYLRRNELNRRFGIETRFPLLDRRLVQYCARLPLRLKIKGWFDIKYILKRAMRDLLPNDILYRRDKLGHSIPMKNWLRDDPGVKAFVLDHLADDVIRRRGYFRPEYVRRLVTEHMSYRRNNSHRLWTLATFEMWLREHHDQSSASLHSRRYRA